jgi:hypothetical protein
MITAAKYKKRDAKGDPVAVLRQAQIQRKQQDINCRDHKARRVGPRGSRDIEMRKDGVSKWQESEQPPELVNVTRIVTETAESGINPNSATIEARLVRK